MRHIAEFGISGGALPWAGTLAVMATFVLGRFLFLGGLYGLALAAGLVALAGSLALLPRAVRVLMAARAGE